MTAPGSVELPPRRTLAWAALVLGVFLAVPMVRLWLDLPDKAGSARVGTAVGAAVGTVILVVLPILGAWVLLRRHVFVSAEAVTVTAGQRVAHELRFADLTEVRPVVAGSAGAATPEFWNKAVVLLGRSSSGRRLALKITRQQVQTIQPLLRALAPVVRSRPDLIPDERDRRLFGEFLGDDADRIDRP